MAAASLLAMLHKTMTRLLLYGICVDIIHHADRLFSYDILLLNNQCGVY